MGTLQVWCNEGNAPRLYPGLLRIYAKYAQAGSGKLCDGLFRRTMGILLWE
jgi:hypothetical protein